MSLIQDNLIDSDHLDNHQNISSTREIQNENFNDDRTNTNDQNANDMNPNANDMNPNANKMNPKTNAMNPSKRKRTSPLTDMVTGSRLDLDYLRFRLPLKPSRLSLGPLGDNKYVLSCVCTFFVL